jgi:saccharopine dehydrogenase-like NADP-dependent oxidoreductase
MQACIEQSIPVYVDLSDPLDFIEAALAKSGKAEAAGTAAVISAGAFPGLSNVLAVELAKQIPAPVADVKFSYFTAGAAQEALSAWSDCS